MLIIPAIDIKDGRCVRLFQGEMDKETVYFEKPIDAARHWVKEGAKFIHVVDLNGAVEGRPVHIKEVEAICRETSLAVELGGGLRSVEAVQAALDLGVARVVIGTAAYDNAGIPARALRKISRQDRRRHRRPKRQSSSQRLERNDVDERGRIGAALRSRRRITDYLHRYQPRRHAGRRKPRRDRKMAQSVNIPVIASGGVATLDDIRRLLPLEKEGVEGVIVGRALYAGAFRLSDARVFFLS